MPQRPKQARRASEPQVSKTPKWNGETPYEGRPLAWRFGSHDKGGPFSFTSVSPEKLAEIIQTFCGYETMNLEQMRLKGCHDLETQKISKEALTRLQQIKLDDVERLYSFRVQQPERLWCWRRENVMLVLWWDPTHKVYPMDMTGNSNRPESRRGRRR